MAQITTGLRAVFSHPAIYSSFQHLMGAHKFRVKFVDEFVRPQPGCRALDIGCGPAEILDYLPEVEYCGFDISEPYIAQAQRRYGARGEFHCRILTRTDIEELPSFDIVLVMGVLHHLNDDEAAELLRLAHDALKPGGRLLTFDPCLEPGQNPFARFLVEHDRGQNVRTRAGYASIANAVFESPRIEVRHQAWIPYTHCFMECTRK
jgi:SAM-dependent methyltransferase